MADEEQQTNERDPAAAQESGELAEASLAAEEAPEAEAASPAAGGGSPAAEGESPAVEGKLPASEPGRAARPAGARAAPAGRARSGQGSRSGAGGKQPRAGGGRGGRGRERDRGGDESGVESSVVRIYRCSKVVKGGRTFSFGALVVAGDRRGQIGIGYGKANEVPGAVEKATKDARKQMIKVNLKGSTIPHLVKGTMGASTVILIPARPGTGVTAGRSVRPVLELAGVSDVLTKAYGSTSPKNLVKAALNALAQLNVREQVEQRRGVALAAGAGELVTS